MKSLIRLALVFIFLAGFIADHSFIDVHTSLQTKNHIQNEVSSLSIFSTLNTNYSDQSNNHGDQDCSDCILGYCSHQVMIPLQFVRDLNLNIASLNQILIKQSDYQDPFYSKLKRPPIV